MTYGEAVEAFVTDRKIAGLSPRTIEFYEYTTDRFLRHTGNIDVTETEKLIVPYFKKMRERELSDSTIHAQLRGLRAFYRFCVEYGYLDTVPKFPRLKTPKQSPLPLSDEELEKIITHLDRCRGFDARRNGAIFRFMVDTGCRLRECLQIDLSDVMWPERQIRVVRKGGKEQWLPFGRTVLSILRSYMPLRTKYAKPHEQALWVTVSGTRMKPTALQTAFRRIGNNVDIHIHPHRLRHTFAVNWIMNGGDAFTLQTLLGHESQHMVARYVKIVGSNVNTQHDRFSPIDRM